MTTLNTTHLIIGFGKAGKTLAKTLGERGEQVILVEQSPAMYGGTCINIGCIPSKKLKFLAQKGSEFHQAINAKNTLTNALNQANFEMLDKVVKVVTGTAKFVDNHSVSVKTADETLLINADYIYINTGAKNRIPNIDGIDTASRVYDSTGIMQLASLPKKLVIIGGGYIGLEFASMFAKFGSEVSVLDMSDTFMPKEDRQIADCLQKIFEKQGIQILLNQKIQKIFDQDNQTIVQTADSQIKADAILIAAGRVPNTDLDLHNTTITTTQNGAISVNERLQTNEPHIYAMGDVAGSPQFTYISLDDFRVVKSQILEDGSYTTSGRTYPYSVFVNPPLSVAGMTEQVATDKGFTVKTATLDANKIPNAKILEQTDGLLKAVVDADTGKVLGVQLLCVNSQEIINFMDLAIRQGLTHQDIATHIFTHPTISEALNDLFGQF